MNGNLHASEIASLSLDIMEHVNRMEIQHIPGTYARLRIGMHSGKPCTDIYRYVLNIDVLMVFRNKPIQMLCLPCKQL